MDIHLEFERKWLLRELPALPFSRVLRMRQGYLEQDGRWVRIRESFVTEGGPGNGETSYILCRKVRKGIGPVEMETALSSDAFTLLWFLCERNQVLKTRHEWRDPVGKLWEFDVYGGPLAGLFTLELELSSPEEPVVLPAAIAAVHVAEVTGDSRWSNRALARQGLPDPTI